MLAIEDVEAVPTFARFEEILREPGPWVGGFDFPFSLPREAVTDLGWPENWPDLMVKLRSLSRAELTAAFDAHRVERAAGDRYLHRAADRAATSSSSMKCVNPPVAWMMHEGAPRLLAANVSIPGMLDGDPDRIALEAYPALVARMAVGNLSYKNDDPKKQTPERMLRREAIVRFVTRKNERGVVVKVAAALRRKLVADASGDTLDAVLCAFQAAVASGLPRSGLPESFDALEGWIVLA
jgi:hypothetical protein